MKELFDNYVENAFGEFKQAEFKFEQFAFNYKKFFPRDKNARLLDIGVGRGEMLSLFKNLGYVNYFGIDISSSCVDFCRSLGLNVELVDSIISFMKDKSETYDLITMIDVLEHIPKDEVIPTLKSIHSSLKSDGILIIQVPNLNSPEGFLHMFNDFSHLNGFNEHSLSQVLIAAGFKHIYFQPFETIIGNSIKKRIKRFLREIIYFKYKLERRITGNISYPIMTPVFSAIVKKI
jgi:2-polyprenyl-3-methyl-5-hydroxy-6-metoxy-1,4-benzoquinol methylase